MPRALPAIGENVDDAASDRVDLERLPLEFKSTGLVLARAPSKCVRIVGANRDVDVGHPILVEEYDIAEVLRCQLSQGPRRVAGYRCQPFCLKGALATAVRRSLLGHPLRGKVVRCETVPASLADVDAKPSSTGAAGAGFCMEDGARRFHLWFRRPCPRHSQRVGTSVEDNTVRDLDGDPRPALYAAAGRRQPETAQVASLALGPARQLLVPGCED
mmetsp:Transcript_86668/g.279957  ORF Transcript_86668/g.279957 Transcript_86668/m.279957 type:complete len:216 (+) Transcript_86668:4031-4678(+)